MNNTIITGGAGFIGSHVVRFFVNKYPDYHIINVDLLTYAGNLENLSDIEEAPNYTFELYSPRKSKTMKRINFDLRGNENKSIQ
jgi:dTDP-D-glucose 4,6-dehydratase